MMTGYEGSGDVSVIEVLEAAQQCNEAAANYKQLVAAEQRDEDGTTYLVRPIGAHAVVAQLWEYKPLDLGLPQSPRVIESRPVTEDEPFVATQHSPREHPDGTIGFEFSTHAGMGNLWEVQLDPDDLKHVTVERMLDGQMLARWTAEIDYDAVVASSFDPNEE